MKPILRAISTSLLLAAIVSSQTQNPAGQLDPEEPRQGQQLALRYDPNAKTATLPRGELFGTVTFVTREGQRHTHVALAEGEDGTFEGAVTVPADATYLHASFITANAHDATSDHQAMVKGDGGRPARGARMHEMFRTGADPAATCAAELADYPDNFGAYRDKWLVLKFSSEASALQNIVRQDLAQIGDANCAPGLWARSYGHMMLGEEDRARELVLQAVDKHPKAFATGRALQDYGYLAYERQLSGVGPQRIEAAVRKLVIDHPRTWLARQKIRELANHADYPLRATRAVCEAWMLDSPLHPEPRLALAVACLRHGVALDEGANHAGEAIDRYLDGRVRRAGDPRAMMSRHLLPLACRVATEIALARQDYTAALGYALIAVEIAPQTTPKARELEAEAWLALGQRQRAELAWARAMALGSTSARGRIEASYQDAGGAPAAFDTHLGNLLAKAGAASERQPAPEFGGVDLDGQAFALTEMRGRVVVLNFWGLGCAPCKVEIPDLSRLVDRYEGRANEVEFFAFATDSEQSLRDYLADHPFAYRVVASAGATAGRYRVQSWPTHVIIDKRGRVAARLIGGGKGQDERLAALIDRLLAE